jgi:Na+-transporting NADH:ubiquinone oxidoreductase subunit NqrC
MKIVKVILIIALVMIAGCIGVMVYAKRSQSDKRQVETTGYCIWFAEPEQESVTSTDTAIYFDDAVNEKKK